MRFAVVFGNYLTCSNKLYLLIYFFEHSLCARDWLSGWLSRNTCAREQRRSAGVRERGSLLLWTAVAVEHSFPAALGSDRVAVLPQCFGVTRFSRDCEVQKKSVGWSLAGKTIYIKKHTYMYIYIFLVFNFQM